MSTAETQTTDPIFAKIRAILALDGIAGQAGEVVISLVNQPGGARQFQVAAVDVDGPYGARIATEETFFLSIRPDGSLLVHLGQSGGTLARFVITKASGFEYQLSAKETQYTFVERRPGGDSRLTATILW